MEAGRLAHTVSVLCSAQLNTKQLESVLRPGPAESQGPSSAYSLLW